MSASGMKAHRDETAIRGLGSHQPDPNVGRETPEKTLLLKAAKTTRAPQFDGHVPIIENYLIVILDRE
jgi:hypothetical protein